jgi:hypothetical protein
VKAKDQTTLAYKFTPSTGKHRNIVVLQAKADDLATYKSALIYAFTGTDDRLGRVAEVTISVSDDNGDQWIVARSQGSSRYYLNRKELTTDAEPSFIRALLDLPNNHLVTDSDRQSVIRLLSSFVQNGRYLGRIESLDQRSKQDPLQEKISHLMGQTQKSISGMLGLELDIEQLEILSSEAFPVLWKWLSMHEHLSNLSTSSNEQAFSQNQQITELEAQLALIGSLERASMLVRDPANSPVAYKEQLTSICANIEKIEQTLPMPAAQINTSPELWQSALNIICKFYTYGKLEHAFQKVRVRIDNTYKPLTKDYLDAIHTFLDNDRNILSELEQALNLLSDQLTTTKQKIDARKDRSVLALIEKFFEKGDKDPLDDAYQQQKSLDTSRELVNGVLAKIGEMHSNIGLSNQAFDQSYGDIQEKYEFLIAEYGKYKSAWLKISKKIGLDPSTSIADFLAVMKKTHRLDELRKQKVHYQTKINDYKLALKQIAMLLEKWYTLIGSHKPQKLNQASVILRETKGILGYQRRKLEKLNRTLKERAINVGIAEFYSSFHKDTKALEKKWQQHFIAMGVQPKILKSLDWQKLQQDISQLLNLSSLKGKTVDIPAKPLVDWMSELALESPLTILDASFGSVTRDEVNLMMGAVSQASPHGHALLLVSDDLLAESLASEGLSAGVMIEASAHQDKTSDISKNIAPSAKPLVSDKAKAAIDILRAKGI